MYNNPFTNDGGNPFSSHPYGPIRTTQASPNSAKVTLNIAYKEEPRMYFASVGRQGHVFNASTIDGLAQSIARSEVDVDSIGAVVGGQVYIRHRDGRRRPIKASKPLPDIYPEEFLRVVKMYRNMANAKKQSQAAPHRAPR